MQLFPAAGDRVDLTGAVLILPGIAAGSVGELAVDAIITTALSSGAARLAGHLDDSTILPVVGPDAFLPPANGRHTLHTSMELYQLTGSKVYVVQQRSPPRKGCQEQFAQNLVAWLKQQGVGLCCVVSGLEDPALRRDDMTLTHPFRYWTEHSGTEQQCQAMHWPRLEQDLLDTDKQAHPSLPPWPVLQAAGAAQLPALLLTMFVSEGNNQGPAMQLAGHTLAWLLQAGHLPASSLPVSSSTADAEAPTLSLVTPWSWRIMQESEC